MRLLECNKNVGLNPKQVLNSARIVNRSSLQMFVTEAKPENQRGHCCVVTFIRSLFLLLLVKLTDISYTEY